MKAFLASTLAAGLALSPVAVVAQVSGPPSQAVADSDQTRQDRQDRMSGPMTKEQHRQKGQEMFKKWDTDGDGTITRQEFDAAHDAKFDKMDANKDGTVSAEEHKAHMRDKKDK